MESSWQLRAATADDADGLKHCMESAYADYQERMGGARLPPMDVDYLSEINNYPTWVAVDDGQVVGGLIMSFSDDQASIANIGVDPDCQGRGIGGALMRLAETQARAQNYAELHLTTHVLLDEVVSLYRHLGWQETARDETRVFMQKSI
ncbi:MAG: GNAT family N-acetyltransferase [Gammaproteobacteria bacterium]|nr:GNAT family N-acetyltransferase [Gammaproteobacteria bacterium]